ncbi:hypothetical protein [Cerasicoccus frondis]|uniref:hypothetical protein n=1 Tax=Cerasicoccus frondis TaxID=490090 RepID=UPI002852587A|nr:hypothetical protein [Cerasicoccus frondis]
MNILKCAATLLCVCVVPLTTLHAASPEVLNYQGFISVNNAPHSGDGFFRFALVDHNGATTYWSHDGSSSAGSMPASAITLAVSEGRFFIRLGDTSHANMTQSIPATVFANASDVYLRIWFDDGANGAQLLSPDQPLGSAGFALAATTADTAAVATSVAAGSVSSAALGTSAVTTDKLADGSVTAAKLASDIDASDANELITEFSLANGTLSLTEAGTTRTVDLNGSEIESILVPDSGFAFRVEGISSEEEIDQQVTDSSNLPIQVSNTWQSFTVGTEGNLVAIEAYLVNGPSPASIDAKLYQGEGDTGTQLASKSVNVDFGESGYVRIAFNSQSVEAGDVLTLALDAPFINQITWRSSNNNPYSQGRSNLGTNSDLYLRTYVKPKYDYDALTIDDEGNIAADGSGLTNLDGAALADSSVSTAKIANSAVTTAKIADNSVSTNKLENESVTAAKLASDIDASDTNELVTDFSLTDAILSLTEAGSTSTVDLSALGSTLLGEDSVTSTAIADNAVTSTELASNAVTTAKIADNAVTAAKLGSDVDVSETNELISSIYLSPALYDLRQSLSLIEGGDNIVNIDLGDMQYDSLYYERSGNTNPDVALFLKEFTESSQSYGGVQIGGTSDPEERLHVSGRILVKDGDSNFEPALILDPTQASDSSSRVKMVLQSAEDPGVGGEYHLSRNAFYDIASNSYTPNVASRSDGILFNEGKISFYSNGASSDFTPFEYVVLDGENKRLGVGVSSPSHSFHVEKSLSSSFNDITPDLDNHIALIRNTNSTGSFSDAHVLALQSENQHNSANFLSCYTRNDSYVGGIMMNLSPSLQFRSGAADYAEYLPKQDISEEIQPADVLGVFGGKVTHKTKGADWIMVASSNPIVVGNMPKGGESNGDSVITAFLGQVDVRVIGKVDIGDYLIPSGQEDGTAIAVTPDSLQLTDMTNVIGCAWEAHDGQGEGKVNAIIGLPGAHIKNQQSLLASLGNDNASLRAANTQIQKKLNQLEANYQSLEETLNQRLGLQDAETEALKKQLIQLSAESGKQSHMSSHEPSNLLLFTFSQEQ